MEVALSCKTIIEDLGALLQESYQKCNALPVDSARMLDVVEWDYNENKVKGFDKSKLGFSGSS